MTTPTHATVTTSPVNATALFSRIGGSSSELGTAGAENAPLSLTSPHEGVGESAETASGAPLRPGMDHGYALSPMAHLWLEYGKHTERTTSTSTRTMGLATKRSLKAEEVIDQGQVFEGIG